MVPKEKQNDAHLSVLSPHHSVSLSRPEEGKSCFFSSLTWLLCFPHVVHSARITVSHCTVQMGSHFSFHFYTNIFKMCKNVGTRCKCLPSERDCHCKQRCMHPHISPVCSLLCRWASNTEAFHMLIRWAVIPVCFCSMFIHCSLNGGRGGSQGFFIPPSYQMDINGKSRSLSTTEKKSPKRTANAINPSLWLNILSKTLSKQSILVSEYSCFSDNMKR